LHWAFEVEASVRYRLRMEMVKSCGLTCKEDVQNAIFNEMHWKWYNLVDGGGPNLL
jgi:hypothetical protein